ncbi:WD40 repeat domain-containing protein [Saccharothrix deserti]|uniref:WD40 repeat domain-containing protein n=1 Tax=Saccharothrix deserti TaxID=2593674 RepID=UPI00131C9E89|nr:WD40 repeat domain-containing protein [Saccharothrix deserti]
MRRIKTGQGDVRDVAISPDGAVVATAGADRTVKLWRTESGDEITTLVGHTAPVQVLAFSPDGATLASGGEDHSVVVWNPATGAGTALAGHTGPVQALAFTHEGELVSGSDDSRVIRWALSPAAAVVKICAETGRDLTAAERSAYLPDGPDEPVCPAVRR